MNYAEDSIGAKCLGLAGLSKSKAGFGAVLFGCSDVPIGEGRNRRSREGENALLEGGVDYAAHAEQAAVIDALKNGSSPPGGRMYVIGKMLRGPQKGFLSVRPSVEDKYFSCIRCAKMFNRFDISVCIPLPSGWHELSPEDALCSARKLKEAGKRLSFTRTST